MLKWIANARSLASIFQPTHHPKEIITFIRTEYGNDVKHLRDEDVLHFYNNLTKNKRSA